MVFFERGDIVAKAKKLPSGNWRCEAYLGRDTNGKQIKKSFTASTRKEAEYLASQYVLEKKHDKETPTFLSAYNQMLELKKPTFSPNYYREYVKNMRSGYYDIIKNIPLSNIDDILVQKMINGWIKKGLDPNTVQTKYRMFKTVVRTFVKSASYDVTLPTVYAKDLYIPTDGEVQKLVEGSKGTSIEIPIMLAAYMGLRKGEIIALRWKNVDMGGRIVKVEESIAIDENNNNVVKKPKSAAGKRALPIPAVVFEALQRHRNDNPIFVCPMKQGSMYYKFKKLQKELGLNSFRFHDLRHYNASVMLALGIPDKYAMERMGHSSNSTLKNIYQHTMKGKQEDISKAIDEYFLKSSHENSHEDLQNA